MHVLRHFVVLVPPEMRFGRMVIAYYTHGVCMYRTKPQIQLVLDAVKSSSWSANWRLRPQHEYKPPASRMNGLAEVIDRTPINMQLVHRPAQSNRNMGM